jgi:hypothetical protein
LSLDHCFDSRPERTTDMTRVTIVLRKKSGLPQRRPSFIQSMCIPSQCPAIPIDRFICKASFSSHIRAVATATRSAQSIESQESRWIRLCQQSRRAPRGLRSAKTAGAGKFALPCPMMDAVPQNTRAVPSSTSCSTPRLLAPRLLYPVALHCYTSSATPRCCTDMNLTVGCCVHGAGDALGNEPSGS